jgi:pyruvate/2-oxoglutarate dehydrogenase complex dihydrolipoamide dehydrogenase (E3) component
VARPAGRLGVHAEAVRVGLPAAIARKDAIVRQWRQGLDRRLAAAGDCLRVVSGHARFVGERQVEVAGERHQSEFVVVNAGVRPVTPAVDGISTVPWLDNPRVMGLAQIPAHLVVLGGGSIGCEFSHQTDHCTHCGGARQGLVENEPLRSPVT